MLDARELKTLSAWCATRAMRWRPLSGSHTPCVLLEPADARRGLQRMVLSLTEKDFELATEAGEKLASASDLHSVLDALEGGVAEAARPALPNWHRHASVAYVV